MRLTSKLSIGWALCLAIGCGRDGQSVDLGHAEEDGGAPVMLRCTGYQDCNYTGTCIAELFPATFDQCRSGEAPTVSTRCISPTCGPRCVVGPAIFDPQAEPGLITTFASFDCVSRDAGADGAVATDGAIED